MIRKIALQVGAVALLVLVAANAYLSVKRLNDTQKMAVLTAEHWAMQSAISTVLKDLTDMETGQRGFLLTGNSSYLEPYGDARGRIGADLSDLRSKVGAKGEQERSLQVQLETLTTAKQAEMERTIDLRQRGYRRRAFNLVDSNEGQGYMDSARKLLTSLSAEESRSTINFEKERNDAVRKAYVQAIAVNAGLLILTACLFGLVRRHGRAVEHEAAQSKKDLAVRDLQLAKLTSVLSNQARSKTSAIEANARMLLQTYGGFLPRHGHQCAEEIQEASAQMEQLRQELVESSDRKNTEPAMFDCVA